MVVNSLQLDDKQGSVYPLPSGFGGVTDLKRWYFYAHGHYTWNPKRWQLQAKTTLSRVTASQTTDLANGRAMREATLVNSLASAAYRWAGGWSVRFQYDHNERLPGLDQTINGYFLANYRTFVRAVPSFHIVRDSRFSVSLNRLNWSRYWWILANASYGYTNGPFLDRIAISNTITFRTIFTEPVRVKRWFGLVQIDKLLVPLATKFHYEGIATRTDLFTFLGGVEPRKSRYETLENNLWFITAFAGPLNAEVGTQLNWSAVQTAHEQDVPTFRTLLAKPRLIVRYKPATPWLIRLAAEQVTWWTNRTQTGSTRLIDILIRYKPIQSKWLFDLTGTNLLNNNQLYFIQINNILISQQAYLLQPRYLTFRVERTL